MANNFKNWLSVNASAIKILLLVAFVIGGGAFVLYHVLFTKPVEYPKDYVALVNSMQDKSRRDSTMFADSMHYYQQTISTLRGDFNKYVTYSEIERQKTNTFLEKLKVDYAQRKIDNFNTDFDGAIRDTRSNLSKKSRPQ